MWLLPCPSSFCIVIREMSMLFDILVLTLTFLLQFCRYLFYLGKIRTIQLEYTDAKESLLQAARKAPVAALGFRVQCNKWAVIVRLLLGEIPERTVFMQKGMEKALRPYFELTNVSPGSSDVLLFAFTVSFPQDQGLESCKRQTKKRKRKGTGFLL